MKNATTLIPQHRSESESHPGNEVSKIISVEVRYFSLVFLFFCKNKSKLAQWYLLSSLTYDKHEHNVCEITFFTHIIMSLVIIAIDCIHTTSVCTTQWPHTNCQIMKRFLCTNQRHTQNNVVPFEPARFLFLFWIFFSSPSSVSLSVNSNCCCVSFQAFQRPKLAFVFELINKIGVSLKLFFNIYSCQLNNNRKIISNQRIENNERENQANEKKPDERKRKKHMHTKAHTQILSNSYEIKNNRQKKNIRERNEV